MTGMKTSDAGIYALALHEGIVPGPYRDSVGVLTYGIGHTAAAGAPDPSQMQRGMPADLDAALVDVFATFRRDLPKYEAGVNRAVKVPITQAQFDALVSFHYNTGAIGKASLVKRLNAGDVEAAAEGFMAWKKPREIIDRRNAEQELFAKGLYPGGKVTVWGVSASGAVIWKPVRTLNMPQVLALLRGGAVDLTLISGVKPAPRPAAAPQAPTSPVPATPAAPTPAMPLLGAALVAAGAALWAKWGEFTEWLSTWF